MPGRLDFNTCIDLGTQYIQAMPFLGCCGTVLWYLQGLSDPKTLEQDLPIVADLYKKDKSVAEIVITESQKECLLTALTKFGFIQTWGPIRNINSQNNLYGFMLDLNDYRKRTSKPSVLQFL